MKTSILLVVCLGLSISYGQILLPHINSANVIYRGGYFLEAPVPINSRKVVFADIPWTPLTGLLGVQQLKGRLLTYDVPSKKVKVLETNSGKANGLVMVGDIIYAAEGADLGGRMISKTNLNMGTSHVVTRQYASKPLNSPNDLVFDRLGRLLFTDPRYEGLNETTEPMLQDKQAVYSVNVNTGETTRLISDVTKPNGIAFSPNGGFLYIGEADNGQIHLGIPAINGRRQIREYVYSQLTGQATFNRVLVDYSNESIDVRPDGITTDQNGNLYVAISEAGAGVWVHSPLNGNRLATIPVPPGVIATNCAFGKGNDRNVLYITGIDFGTFEGVLMSIKLASRGLL